ncbi:MAG: alpha/beta hydrolase [Alphaproteobacteria bacterium]
MTGQIIAIDVRAAELGDKSPRQGVQDLVRPRIYGRLAEEGCSKDVAYLVLHPAVNFMHHYLIEPLQARGKAVLGLNTRYVNNDSTLLVERVIQDIGAGVKFLRERGYKRVVYIGNSGGGSVGTLYQSQAENLTIETTPDGLSIDLYNEDLPPVDAIVLASCHIGRGRHFGMSLDPSVIDERDLTRTDPDLDMFNPKNGPPYEKEWLARYAAAQRARHQRITDWALARLREIDAMPDEAGITDEAFLIHRTYARPQVLDPTIDPNDRPVASSIWGGAKATNYSASILGRFTTLRSYLSQWSLLGHAADGPARLAETSVPVINIRFSADEGTYPSLSQEYTDAARGRCDEYTLKGARHFPYKQENGPEIIADLADTIAEWGNRS